MKYELQLYCNNQDTSHLNSAINNCWKFIHLFLSCYKAADCCYGFENTNKCTRKMESCVLFSEIPKFMMNPSFGTLGFLLNRWIFLIFQWRSFFDWRKTLKFDLLMDRLRFGTLRFIKVLLNTNHKILICISRLKNKIVCYQRKQSAPV